MSLTDGDLARIKVGGIFAGILLLVFLIYSAVTYRSYTQGIVTELSWERQIQLLQYQTFHENAWNPPGNARITDKQWEWRSSYSTYSYSTYSSYNCGTTKRPRTCRREIKHYRTVNVYDWKYYYDIDRWVNIPPLITSGHDKELVAWPTNPYQNTAPDVIGNIKSGEYKEKYTITIAGDNKKTYEYVCPNYDYWRAQYTGKNLKLTVGFFNNLIEIGE